MDSDMLLIIIGFSAIALLLILILKFKFQAFIALLIVSILVGLAVGMPPLEIVETIEDAMGSTLGFVALVICAMGVRPQSQLSVIIIKISF